MPRKQAHLSITVRGVPVPQKPPNPLSANESTLDRVGGDTNPSQELLSQNPEITEPKQMVDYNPHGTLPTIKQISSLGERASFYPCHVFMRF